MNETSLYPLRFEPIFQYRIWGGRRLSNLVPEPLPPDDPIGEAWILSDRDDLPSRVAEGPLKGCTLKELAGQSREGLFGNQAAKYSRFPLLLKFLDAKQVLSVQVHPSDNDKQYLPPGERGKTEAWLVLETGPEAQIFGGLKPGVTEASLREALAQKSVADCINNFRPKVGEGVFLPAGTVHTFGDTVVFEVQQNSDVTFRLYDFDRIDVKTGKPRDLQIEESIACINFDQGPIAPVIPKVEEDGAVKRERIFECEFFVTWRLTGSSPMTVGKAGEPRLVICIGGGGVLESGGATYPLHKGNVFMLPASVGECACRPSEASTLLEVAVP